MAETTKIQWADHTWSPWIGCSKIASGCLHCYAEADFDTRRGVAKWGPNGTRVKTSEAYWRRPLAWNRKAGTTEHLGSIDRPRVFPSLCDQFEDWNGPVLNSDGHELWVSDDDPGRCVPYRVPFEKLTPLEQQNIADGTYRRITLDDLRRDMFELIDATPNLDWLLLTKRPENITDMWAETPSRTNIRRENVWLIYSASDQESLYAGCPHLTRQRDLVPVLGFSLEPLVGPVILPCTLLSELDWVIVGGESGPHARPCCLEWIDDIRRQCATASVPCFIKQLGSQPVTENANIWDFPAPMKNVGQWWGNTVAGCHVNLDDSKGGSPDEWPMNLRVRQFPNATERSVS